MLMDHNLHCYHKKPTVHQAVRKNLSTHHPLVTQSVAMFPLALRKIIHNNLGSTDGLFSGVGSLTVFTSIAKQPTLYN